MSSDPSGIKQLKRLGYRLPRRKLLPPYMTDPYFQELGDIIDATYKEAVDGKIAILSQLRTGWHSSPETEALVLDEQLLDNSDWNTLERELLTKQVNSLGLFLSSASGVSLESLQNVTRFLGTYWWERGTYGSIEFINYCLGLDLRMINMWAEIDPDDVNSSEYFNMTVENADGTPPGTPVWDGGTWYPTTHVSLQAYGGLPIAMGDLATFFYEIANFNLVLYAIDQIFDVPVVAFPGDGVTRIVATATLINQSAVALFTKTST